MIIIGGGKIGQDLARMMLEKKHVISIIECNRARCERLANELDAEIIMGDGTNIKVLEKAHAQNCDCIMAVTGSDQDNLVAAQIGKNYFNAKKVIARASNPRNIETFRVLGIANTVSSTEIISKMIEHEADLSSMHLLTTLNEGQAEILSVIVKPTAKIIGKSLKELIFPKDTLIISIIRHGVLSIPNGSSVIKANDEVIALSDEKARKALVKMISG